MSIDSVYLSMMDRWNSLGDSLLFEDAAWINDVKYNPVDGCIYLAGKFMSIGGVAAAGIAKFDPATKSFSALGAGYGAEASCLAIDPSGNVYVAGGAVNGVVKKWNGSSMITLLGLTGPVYVMDCDSAGNLYAGGTFVDAGGNPNADKIAMYNGQWNPCGTAFAGSTAIIRALKVDQNDRVVIGGSFTNIGDANGDFIVRWDGTSYSSVGGGLNGDVFALDIDAVGKIYALGYFTSAGGDVNANRVAVFDGANWGAIGGVASPLITNLASPLYHFGIAVHNDKVFVATAALPGGSINAAYLWDGNEWRDLGIVYNNMNAVMQSVDVDPGGKAYFGGDVHSTSIQCFGSYGSTTLAEALDYLFMRIADNWFSFGDYINAPIPIASVRYVSPSKGTLNATESLVVATAPFDMLIDQVGVVTTTAQHTSNNMTVTLRRNLASTALVVTINAGEAAGQYERYYPIAFLKGDRISIQFDNNASASSASINRYYLRGRMIRS